MHVINKLSILNLTSISKLQVGDTFIDDTELWLVIGVAEPNNLGREVLNLKDRKRSYVGPGYNVYQVDCTVTVDKYSQ